MKLVLNIIYYLACLGIIYSVFMILKKKKDSNLQHKEEGKELPPNGSNFLKDALIQGELKILYYSVGIALLSLITQTIFF